jgi:hypothetical protein
VEVGSLVARRVDPTHKYRVIYITTDYKAIAVSKHSPNTSAIIDVRCGRLVEKKKEFSGGLKR